jgi:hypothetical protein
MFAGCGEAKREPKAHEPSQTQPIATLSQASATAGWTCRLPQFVSEVIDGQKVEGVLTFRLVRSGTSLKVGNATKQDIYEVIFETEDVLIGVDRDSQNRTVQYILDKNNGLLYRLWIDTRGSDPIVSWTQLYTKAPKRPAVDVFADCWSDDAPQL